jgi:hypothetical protein
LRYNPRELPKGATKRERKPRAVCKPTNEGLRARVGRVADLLVAGRRKGEIKRELCRCYRTSALTAERYLAAARRLLQQRSDKTLDEHLAEAATFYESIIRDWEKSHYPDVFGQPVQKIIWRMADRAQASLCRLLELYRR